MAKKQGPKKRTSAKKKPEGPLSSAARSTGTMAGALFSAATQAGDSAPSKRSRSPRKKASAKKTRAAASRRSAAAKKPLAVAKRRTKAAVKAAGRGLGTVLRKAANKVTPTKRKRKAPGKSQ